MWDIELLEIEMDLLWGPDLYGRPSHPHPIVALARADDRWALRFAPDATESLREALARDPSPEGLEGFRTHLTEPTPIEGGPSYVFPGEVPFSPNLRIVTSEAAPHPHPPGARLQRNERPNDRRVPRRTLLSPGGERGVLRPEAWGDDEEWGELMAGRLGPWAVGLEGDRVVCVGYTPVASANAAELGIWTLPEARGRGYAPVVSAAWAEVAGARFGTLFYSTSFDNAASQAVARKLRLRPIGAIWQIRR